MRPIIAWFVRNRVAAELLMIAMAVGGLIAAPAIPVKLFPDIDYLIVTVDVAYPGAAPDEVEQGVCVPVEEAIEGVVGIQKISTYAREGHCRTVVEVENDADGNVVATNIRNRVDNVRTFPGLAERPVVAKLERVHPVIEVMISGPIDLHQLEHLADRVRDELLQRDELSQAELIYLRDHEIAVEVSEETLRRHGLSFAQIAGAIQRSSLDLPGGAIKAPGGEVLLRAKGQGRSGDDFEDVAVVARPDGTRLRLGEIAQIRDDYVEGDLDARFDGRQAVMLRIFRVGDEDLVAISDAVKSYIAARSATLPEGIDLTVWQDKSLQVRERLGMMLSNGLSGLALVFVLLLLLMRFRLAFWVCVGVPTSVLGTLMTMPLFGVSFDQVTLFAFILVLGILVDDAIVVAENIYSHEQRSGNRFEAAIRGTQEVTVPVIFGVLTTIAAFAPMLFVPGRMGQIFSFLGITVILCLTYSLIESQLVLPSHLAHGRSEWPRGETSGGPWSLRWQRFQGFFERGLEHLIERRYRPLLRKTLYWRYTAVAAGIGFLLLIGVVATSGHLRFRFFAPTHADYIAAQLVMPQGTPAAQTLAGVQRLEAVGERVMQQISREAGVELVQHRLVSIGHHAFVADNSLGRSGGGHLGEVVFELLPAAERPYDARFTTEAIARAWREQAGGVAGALELSFAYDLFSAGAPIALQLRGASAESLEAAAVIAKQRLADYPGVFDVADTREPGKDELQLEILPGAESLGLTLSDLASQVRQAFYGEEVQRIQRGRHEVKVVVRYPELERRSLADLDELRIRTPEGAEVPFWSVARVESSRGYSSIRRSDGDRVIEVTAYVDPGHGVTPNQVVADFTEKAWPEIARAHPDVAYRFGGEQEDQAKAFSGLVRAFPMVLLAIFALLAIPLGSFLQPLIIMSVIPFGIVGAVLGHLLMGFWDPDLRSMSFSSLIGIFALSGVVVNASLVLVDRVNRLREEGLPMREAVMEAAVSRFRPILLTDFTTFVGLVPMLFARSMQAKVLVPMSISLGYGVLFATVITLLLVPCGYLILEDLRDLWQRRAEWPRLARRGLAQSREEYANWRASLRGPADRGAL